MSLLFPRDTSVRIKNCNKLHIACASPRELLRPSKYTCFVELHAVAIFTFLCTVVRKPCKISQSNGLKQRLSIGSRVPLLVFSFVFFFLIPDSTSMSEFRFCLHRFIVNSSAITSTFQINVSPA